MAVEPMFDWIDDEEAGMHARTEIQAAGDVAAIRTATEDQRVMYEVMLAVARGDMRPIGTVS